MQKLKHKYSVDEVEGNFFLLKSAILLASPSAGDSQCVNWSSLFTKWHYLSVYLYIMSVKRQARSSQVFTGLHLEDDMASKESERTRLLWFVLKRCEEA